MKHTIRIDGGGRVRSIYSDALAPALSKLGPLQVQRASTVEFNPATQQWEVRWTQTPNIVSFSHPSRAECLRWEVEQLTKTL